MNDVFDILNGRCPSQSITKDNWNSKKEVLKEMLSVLEKTEKIHKQVLEDRKSNENKMSNIPNQMFCSDTTLRAWRTSLSSTLLLVEEMFLADFDMVLSGRWNQDPIEVFNIFEHIFFKY